MARIKPHDPDRQRRIDDQSEHIAETIGVDPEKVMTDGNYGVTLTPDQIDALLPAIRLRALNEAISFLMSRGQMLAANSLASLRHVVSEPEERLTDGEISAQAAVEGVNRSLSNRWCNHRCREGRHCGGCGCVGCGYTA